MIYKGYWFKRSIQKKVYGYYLNGFTIELIGLHLGMDEDDINDIIDYINEIYH